MIPPIINLEIRKGDTKTILKIDDRLYISKGAIQGDLNSKEQPETSQTASYFTLILAADQDGNEYLISTEDNIPKEIEKGSRNEIVGQGYGSWGMGNRFYIDRFRTRLISEHRLDWDEFGTMYIND